MRMFILPFVFLLFISCCSTPTPVIIYPLPEADISDDMSLDRYLAVSTQYAVEMKGYVDELINQIIYKSNYIDLRKGKRSDGKTGKHR